MNTALERRVKGFNTVGRQEEDTGEVFELPEEHRNEGVAFNIVNGTFLKEYIRLVDKHYRTPNVRNVEDLIESLVKLIGVCSQVASSNNVEGLADVFRCGLCRHGLADTRRTEETG